PTGVAWVAGHRARGVASGCAATGSAPRQQPRSAPAPTPTPAPTLTPTRRPRPTLRRHATAAGRDSKGSTAVARGEGGAHASTATLSAVSAGCLSALRR